MTLDVKRKYFRVEKPGKPVQEAPNETYTYGARNFEAGLRRMNNILNEAKKRQPKLRATLNPHDPLRKTIFRHGDCWLKCSSVSMSISKRHKAIILTRKGYSVLSKVVANQ